LSGRIGASYASVGELILIRHIHGMRSSWWGEGPPGDGRRDSDRGCPLFTVVARLIWHAGGTADYGQAAAIEDLRVWAAGLEALHARIAVTSS
jgi:hypothetical protein